MSDLVRPHIWTSRWSQQVADPDRCRHAVHEGGRGLGYYQCQRAGKKSWTDPTDGMEYLFCTQHHPETVTRKRREQEAKWQSEHEALHAHDRRKSAIQKFIGSVSTDTIEQLPPLSTVLHLIRPNGVQEQ